MSCGRTSPALRRGLGLGMADSPTAHESASDEECSVRDVLLSSADVLEGEALTLQQSHTLPPEHTDWGGEEDAEDTYKHWMWLACALRKIADE